MEQATRLNAFIPGLALTIKSDIRVYIHPKGCVLLDIHYYEYGLLMSLKFWKQYVE